MVAGLEGECVNVWPCLKGLVLDCLMRTSRWLGEWELGTSVISVEVRLTEGSNGHCK